MDQGRKRKKRMSDAEYARRRAIHEAQTARPDEGPMQASTLSRPFGTRGASYRGKVQSRSQGWNA